SPTASASQVYLDGPAEVPEDARSTTLKHLDPHASWISQRLSFFLSDPSPSWYDLTQHGLTVSFALHLEDPLPFSSKLTGRLEDLTPRLQDRNITAASGAVKIPGWRHDLVPLTYVGGSTYAAKERRLRVNFYPLSHCLSSSFLFP
ncbi:hypothetical protein Taro_050494, partial [Colocasia esculenta]|nr:hypothetical protein [Colocasia esculenta]